MTAGTVVITGGILATVILLCIIAVLCYCRLQVSVGTSIAPGPPGLQEGLGGFVPPLGRVRLPGCLPQESEELQFLLT